MRIIRLLILNIALSILAVILVFFLIEIDRLWLPPLPEVLETFAWPLFIVGTLLILSAVYCLCKYSGASGAPGDPTQNLVYRGPYKWMRNPICLGGILLLIGVGLFIRSTVLIMMALVSIPGFHYMVCRFEEPKTEERLGDVYCIYKSQVPRWIPRLGKTDKDSNNG